MNAPSTSITEDRLAANPYAIFEELRASKPVAWVHEFNMWYVVDYDCVTEILMDDTRFVTGSDSSTIFDTFGLQMLSAEGLEHRRYKLSLRGFFRPKTVASVLEASITELVDDLISGFASEGQAELRSRFARRLPVLTMLQLFGLPSRDESLLRGWYDSFEKALANFKWDESVREAARRNVREFHEHIESAMARLSADPDDSLTSALVNAPAGKRLTDDEIKRNASIVLFGGISTVEALILNAVWAFSRYPDALDDVMSDWSLLPNAIEEVIRWHSPVQSATRHATADTEIGGVSIRKGDTVNCMLGAANRDPRAFENPDEFDIHREFPRAKPHLGFAVGPHNCLGLHLARLEARVALRRLYETLPGLRMDPDKDVTPCGYEFHQPPSLYVTWK